MLDYDTIELNKLLIEINDIKLIDQIILTGVCCTLIYQQFIRNVMSFISIA
jgi:predicted SprT family Zn-dependent metalloprotease